MLCRMRANQSPTPRLPQCRPNMASGSALDGGRKNGRFRAAMDARRMAAMMKGFGCGEAYESLPCRNPRATVDGYGDFDLQPMSALARLLLESSEADTDRRLRCVVARLCRPGTRFVASLPAAVVTMDSRMCVAGGVAPAADAWTRSCRVTGVRPALPRLHQAVLAAACTVRRSR